MKRTLCAVGIAALCLTWAVPTRALVLCSKKSGVVVLRTACKKKEKPLDIAQFGVVGPKGDKGDPGSKGDPGAPGVGPLTSCPADSVLVGTTCVDTYEASVWLIAPSNTALVQNVQAGGVTLADLTAGGGVQLSPASSCDPAYPVYFPSNGQWTPVFGSSPPSPGVYAVSIPGVHPSACVTWFQAAQACRLSGKRLATNLEWQDAAAGTPDPGTDNGTSDCNISTAGDAVDTGSRSNCKSSWGAFDMVGNVVEWVADWGDLSTVVCGNWPAEFGSDQTCVGGNGSSGSFPGAPFRGGAWVEGTNAGVFYDGNANPSLSNNPFFGFRCAR
jgi:hypothetical protein